MKTNITPERALFNQVDALVLCNETVKDRKLICSAIIAIGDLRIAYGDCTKKQLMIRHDFIMRSAGDGDAAAELEIQLLRQAVPLMDEGQQLKDIRQPDTAEEWEAALEIKVAARRAEEKKNPAQTSL